MEAEIEPGGYRKSATHTPGVITPSFKCSASPANASIRAIKAADAAKVD
jgi:hypothetical protein